LCNNLFLDYRFAIRTAKDQKITVFSDGAGEVEKAADSSDTRQSDLEFLAAQ
jgi:hypothetical protein